MVTLAAQGLHGSGALRLLQSFSRRFEISRPGPGRRIGFRRVTAPKFAIICYHRVGSGGVPFYSNLPPRVFEAQIRFLRSAYRIVTLDDLCRELDEGAGPGQGVAITFDDGYRDLYTNVFPVLRRYGVPATVYLTAAAIETGEISWYDRIFALAMSHTSEILELEGEVSRRFHLSSYESRLQAAIELVKILRGCPNHARIAACALLERQARLPKTVVEDRMLSWEQVREMKECGISFGAHTMNHPVVSRLSPTERECELGSSKRLLEERLQQPVAHFAYPFGSASDIDAESCSLMPHYGYRSAVSTVWGVNTSETQRYLLRRVGGEELSLPRFSARLRWAMVNEQETPAEMEMLEKTVQGRKALLDCLPA